MSGPLVNQIVRAAPTSSERLIRPLRAALPEAPGLETLQKFLLGHALDGNLGVVSIDAGACRPDQGHGIRLRFVDFDEFLQ